MLYFLKYCQHPVIFGAIILNATLGQRYVLSFFLSARRVIA